MRELVFVFVCLSVCLFVCLYLCLFARVWLGHSDPPWTAFLLFGFSFLFLLLVFVFGLRAHISPYQPLWPCFHYLRP